MTKPLGFLLTFLLATAGFAQECGKIEQSKTQLTITIDSIRPMWSLANTLGDKYGVLVSAEEPVSISPLDMEDVHTAYPNSKTAKHYLVPKRRHLEIHGLANKDGTPNDLRRLLWDAVRAVNEVAPFGYRLDHDREFFVLVPTTTRDADGKAMKSVALLDRKVTVPAGTRTVAESAGIMADQLSAQTGLKVSCCQMFVAGVPWGQSVVPFEAKDEPARSVLERLIRLEQENYQFAKRVYWTVSCDGGYCFIETHSALGRSCSQYASDQRLD